MLDPNDRLPTDKNQLMSTSDKLLAAVLVIVFVVSFPIMWRVYRYLFPLALLAIGSYFFVKLVVNTSKSGGEPGNSSNAFGIYFKDFITGIRKSFKVFVGVSIAFIIFSVGILLGFQYYTKPSTTLAQINRMAQSIEKFKYETSAYPVSLAQLIGNDPLKKAWWQDAWGNPIRYEQAQNMNGYTLTSPGPDGSVGTGDDIVIKK